LSDGQGDLVPRYRLRDGRAAAQALGLEARDFDEAYAAARARQQGSTLEDPLALAL
jgi:hypothetical protein